MNDDHIRQVIVTLDAEIADAGDARVHFEQVKPPYCILATANRAGLLRLARTSLLAALEPMIADDCRSRPMHDPDLVQVREGKSDRFLGFIERMEAWPEPVELIQERRRKAYRQDRFALLGCGVVACVLLTVFMAGLIAIWKAI